MKKLILLVLACQILLPQIFSQSNVDSLENIISLGRRDVAEADALNKLAEFYARKDYSKSVFTTKKKVN